MKTIAFIADVKGWAFDLAAHMIKKELKEDFKIDIFYSKSEEFGEDLGKIIERVKNYDIIHFFWRKTLLQFYDLEFQNKLIEQKIEIDKLKQKISTGIYDHLFIDDPMYDRIFNEISKKYVTSSEKLYEIYCQNNRIKKPWGILGDTFDEKLFYPKKQERGKGNEDSSFVIGWVGNSAWNHKLRDENGKQIDFKGFHTVLMPVIEELQKEGYQIETYYADKNTNFIPNDKMPEYYHKLNVYICASITEGTPKPLLEAMGCGVPVITTDVGIAREYMGPKQSQFVIGERQIGKSDDEIRKELKKKIIELYHNPTKQFELAQENYENSKKFNSKAYGKKYKEYFLNF